ncbi:DNA adenine methylase [Pectobacterium punjabense]|uniref:site-specific DNA-methyltransferase (adenine-specific) n=1 Tax=Pectobacterium punjabense TaxID=2108399 RepID=A0ABX6L2B4_9GAMM|nr:DNA adenine methylase [Pectobacterium punjabense]MBS4433256.1 DNA adenine methylase [Pectobacterium punjabense]PTA64132.1 DNA methyltransferase [Pectobacterium punjabense]QJA19897.1 DNA adenine methylase [Pectobacterium punjabense]
MRFGTPLRYPGGKGKLTEYLKLVLIQNELVSGHYVEPYAGGSGIAINLLLQGYVSHIHLNDINYSVYAFWHSVLNDTDKLCEMIISTKVTIDEWHNQKMIQKNVSNFSLLEVGFSTFFLNRTNRSGILTAGVIGGKNQEGNWKLDARYNKEDLVSRIERIYLNKEKISLYNIDAKFFIKDILPNFPDETLIYLDPPYYVKGQGLYENHYTHDDHLEIAKIVQNDINHPWVVSYDNVSEIADMYNSSESIIYGINYSAQNRYEGSEIMFFSDKIQIPDVKNPSNLRAS